MLIRDLQFLKDILVRCDEILEFTDGLTKDEFVANKLVKAGVERHIITIGEAAKNLSSELRSLYPLIEWRAMGRTRDILVHHYFGTNRDIIWDIVKRDIPKLRKDVWDIISEQGTLSL